MAWFSRLAALALLGACLASALEPEPIESFSQRRRALAAEHPDGAILLFGYREGEGQAGHEPFRQENNFYYLTGWNEPEAALLLTPPEADRAYQETLFVPAPTSYDTAWSGPRVDPAASGAPLITGVQTVSEASGLERAVRRAAKRYGRIYSVLPAKHPIERRRLVPDSRDRIAALAANAEIADIRPAIERLRLVKSANEVRLIEQAVDASVAAHRAAWDHIRPGLREYQVVAPMLAALINRGALRMAYPPIVGSGPNSVILHYWRNRRQLAAGDVLLMDVGGEYQHYAADITRTVPVSGRFTERQREVYNLVLGAQEAVLDAVRPGMTLDGHGKKSLSQIARNYFDRAQAGLSAHFLHGVGHHVGLDVHDPGGSYRPLEPGMVITVEPGLYFRDEGLGIRIEDVVVVTEDGMRNLSAALPKRRELIEQALQGGS